jgi:hypothetical protein
LEQHQIKGKIQRQKVRIKKLEKIKEERVQ